MGCRESILVEKSTIDFPIFLLFFNTKFPIFPIFSILSFLISYFFEQPCRWTPWQSHWRISWLLLDGKVTVYLKKITTSHLKANPSLKECSHTCKDLYWPLINTAFVYQCFLLTDLYNTIYISLLVVFPWELYACSYFEVSRDLSLRWQGRIVKFNETYLYGEVWILPSHRGNEGLRAHPYDSPTPWGLYGYGCMHKVLDY